MWQRQSGICTGHRTTPSLFIFRIFPSPWASEGFPESLWMATPPPLLVWLFYSKKLVRGFAVSYSQCPSPWVFWERGRDWLTSTVLGGSIEMNTRVHKYECELLQLCESAAGKHLSLPLGIYNCLCSCPSMWTLSSTARASTPAHPAVLRLRLRAACFLPQAENLLAWGARLLEMMYNGISEWKIETFGGKIKHFSVTPVRGERCLTSQRQRFPTNRWKLGISRDVNGSWTSTAGTFWWGAGV